MSSAICQPLESRSVARAAGPVNAPGRNDARLVVLLTIVAGAARLGTASVPALWNDEAQTFRRVCGTFGQLSAALRQDAFPPLHYYAYWALGRTLGGAQHLTPFWMRVIPALCGTLMVPVMWRLAGQLCGRRVALLVATLTACSAFLFAYAHDAKMYMPLWLLVAANVSAWLSCTRGESGWKGWTVWVLTGIGMVGYHATGLAVVGVEVAHAFTMRLQSWRAPVAAGAGFALILLGPVCYYVWCNDLVTRSQAIGWHNASGLGWLGGTGPGVGPLWQLWKTYLLGWSDAGRPIASHGPAYAHWFPWLRYTLAIVGGLLLAAGLWGGILLIFRVRQSGPAGAAGTAVFSTTFLLAFWVAAPLYAGYRLSTASPHVRPTALTTSAIVCFALAALLLAKAAWSPLRERMAARGVSKPLIDAGAAAFLAAAIAWVIGALTAAFTSGGAESSSVWIPRYLAFVWPAVAILTCAGVMAIRPRPVRWLAIALLIGTNVAQAAAMVFAANEPPVDRIASDVCDAARSGGELRTYVTDRPPSSTGTMGGTLSNAVGRYYLAILTGNRLGPRGFSESDLDDFVPVRFWSDPPDLTADLSQGLPHRLIVWDYLPAGTPPDPPVLPGPGWRLVEDRIIPVRDHWTWRTLYFYRRAQFARGSP
jgi:hypothetical protein